MNLLFSFSFAQFLTYAQTPLPPVKCELSSVTTGSLGWTAEAERGFVADLWSRSIPALPPPRPRLGCKNRIGSGKCRQLWSTINHRPWSVEEWGSSVYLLSPCCSNFQSKHGNPPKSVALMLMYSEHFLKSDILMALVKFSPFVKLQLRWHGHLYIL